MFTSPWELLAGSKGKWAESRNDSGLISVEVSPLTEWTVSRGELPEPSAGNRYSACLTREMHIRDVRNVTQLAHPREAWISLFPLAF